MLALSIHSVSLLWQLLLLTVLFFSEQSSNDEFLKALTYKQLASVVKQCEKASDAATSVTISASAAGTTTRSSRGNNHGRNNGLRRPSNSALKRLPCHECGNFGHLSVNSHKDDGSLKDGVKAFDNSGQFLASLGSNGNDSSNSSSGGRHTTSRKRTVSFNMGVLSSNMCTTDTSKVTKLDQDVGPLVDDGAPYSAIGRVELRLLLDNLGHTEEIPIDPIPIYLNGHTHW